MRHPADGMGMKGYCEVCGEKMIAQAKERLDPAEDLRKRLLKNALQAGYQEEERKINFRCGVYRWLPIFCEEVSLCFSASAGMGPDFLHRSFIVIFCEMSPFSPWRLCAYLLLRFR
jgi:hypothetical protein